MFPVLSATRKTAARIFALVSLMVVAACGATGTGGPSINASAPVPVALLVPSGSGNAGDDQLAASLENAARLAIADLGGVQIDLRVYSTAGRPDVAAGAATKAINDGARIILGPVYAEAAAAVGVAAGARGINVLAFSNNPAIAGGNVFVLGQTFQGTADRLVRHAVANGKSRIMIVHGQDLAESAGRDAVQGAIGRNGAVLAGVTAFEQSQQGVINAVPQISRDARSNGAQAVFLTSGTSGALPFLSQLLPENGLTPQTTQFIGLQRWDIPASALSLPGLQGGWFAIPDPVLAQNFQNRYLASYGTGPHPIAGLAYDGIAAIGALVSQGRSDALTHAALTQGSGFVGVSGVFRFNGDGTNQRGLAVATIQNNQMVVIDPAPRSFGGAGL